MHTSPDTADRNDILTVSELHAALTAALARGLHPDTAVVIGPADHDWLQTSREIGDPTLGDYGEWLWYTLFTAAPADPRFTPEHAYYCGYCGTFGHIPADCLEREVTS